MKPAPKPLTVERLKTVLSYDADTGHFIWLVRKRQRALSSPLAGDISSAHGYRSVGIDGERYLAHRLAWFYTHGVWPSGNLDHINCSRQDNRISNLRECTQSQNLINIPGVRSDNTSGYRGVYWGKRENKWIAKLNVRGKQLYLGAFADPQKASAAVKAARLKHFGEFVPYADRDPSLSSGVD